MPKPATEKMADYRARLRAQGLRPVQFWVPDLRDPEQRERLRRSIALVRDHPSSAEGNRFAEAALAEVEGWVWGD